VECNPGKATGAKWGEAVFGLEPAELALDGSASTVELLPSLRLTGDERVGRSVFTQTDLGLHSPDGQRHFGTLGV